MTRDNLLAKYLSGPRRLLALPTLALGAAVIFSGMYFVAAIPRVFYPYDLDFIEDGLLMTALRVANGQAVFLPPNAEFVPHVYMPLYTWLGGLLFKVTSPGFAPLRLLSLTATIATAALIYGIARRESNLPWVGPACAGLFLGGYRIVGFWYELARVDSLYMMLVLAGLALASPRPGIRAGLRLALAAIALTLASFTKQTGVIFAACLGLYLFLTIGRRAWIFAVIFGGLTIPLALALNIRTDGWFFYYTITIAGANPIEAGRILNYAARELLGVMAGLSLMAVGAVLLGARRQVRPQPWLIWLGVAAVVSGTGRASIGGNLNNLIPVYTLLCLAPAILLREWRAHPALLPGWRAQLVALLILAQFGLGAYNPVRYIPAPELEQRGDRLIERLAQTNGDVLVLMHPYYARLAGKTPSAQLAAIWHARQRGAKPLPPDFVTRIRDRHYEAIISDQSLFETEPDLLALLAVYYRPPEGLPLWQRPLTLSGMLVQPQVIYRPK